MTAQEVYLQLFDLLVRDADVAKLAETSSDSVDDLIFFQGAANYAAAVHDALAGLAWKPYGFEIPCHATSVSSADVNQIRSIDVPCARSLPLTMSPDDAPRLNLTTTPGSIANR